MGRDSKNHTPTLDIEPKETLDQLSYSTIKGFSYFKECRQRDLNPHVVTHNRF